ncbi:MAG: exodeoxyribonuclease III [Gammaproteobacteria bacterium]
MKVATWNVNSLRVRLLHLLDWLSIAQPDILALQETKLLDEHFPLQEIADAGYQVIFSGQKSYNGVALLSRIPARDVVKDIPRLADPQRRVLAATYGDIRVLNIYVPNGASVGSEKYSYKLSWLDQLCIYIESQLALHPRLVVLGDFNIAPEDRDVHDPQAWEGQVMVSEAERAYFSRLLSLGLCDTFRLFEQQAEVFSWWDYRAAAFRRNLGLRIDHILVSPALREHCLTCNIDKSPRKLERPSDHAPVIAEFGL